MSSPRPVVWSVAASDSGGGAGIQADLNTLHSHQCHGCTLITAITAQNSIQVEKISVLDASDLEAQWQVLAKDMLPKAIKIGMLSRSKNLSWLAQKLRELKNQQQFFCVWDPVLKASTGVTFTDQFRSQDIDVLLSEVDLITPNLSEASALTGIRIESHKDIELAAKTLIQRGANAVLIKGGHSVDDNPEQEYCQDYFLSAQTAFWLQNERQRQNNNHGTGCTLASAIAANLAHGKDLHQALILANSFIQQSLRLAVQQGAGAGPVWQWPPQNNGADFPRLSLTPKVSKLIFEPARNPGIYAIVDSLQWGKDCIAAGVDTLQWRVKNPSEQAFQQLAELIDYCRQHDCPLYINDHWQMAIELKAYGVHLGQEDLQCETLLQQGLTRMAAQGMRLGISCHNEVEIARARHFNPSYLAFGPVFPARSKQVDHPCLGTAQLHEWVRRWQTQLPLTCIGGIDPHNLNEIMATGIQSVAVISALKDQQGRHEFIDLFQQLRS